MADRAIVHVVDDDDALRDSLSFLLDTAGYDARSYDSAESYLAAQPSAPAGCIVTDVRMSGLSGIDLLRRLRQQGSALPVIVITGHADVPLAVEAMKLGAQDFIEKPFEDEVLLGAVERALERSRHETDAKATAASLQVRVETLSARERQVLDGLIAGKANKIIAFDLGISARTVEIYRANVMTKMQANSLSELVRIAIAAGVLPRAT